MTLQIPQPAWTVPIDSEEATLQLAGGKGANLSRLARADLEVPGGFIVTTQAYRQFVLANHLDTQIRSSLAEDIDFDLESLESSSKTIRSLFFRAEVPIDMAEALKACYRQLGAPPVAVRSSATAEDLPGMSFAGQQDTFLNIVGEENLIDAVRDCWGSLWTARAIGYRNRNHISHDDVALAVVVQTMIESRVSGVMFTANPVTGLRSVTVIDASFGLGEALVSGMVEPDHFVVDVSREQIIDMKQGAKAMAIHGKAGGGTIKVDEPAGDNPALVEGEVLELTRLGKRVQQLYEGYPQDIEFAWKGKDVYLLQSRPITSLFPLPQGMPAEPLQVLFSFGAVQGMLDPVTPLGVDVFKLFSTLGSSLFGGKATIETQKTMAPAGERLWVNITGLVRNSVGRRAVKAALSYVEPSIRKALVSCMNDPRLVPERNGIRPQTAFRMGRFFIPLVGNAALNLISPTSRRKLIVQTGETTLTWMSQKLEAVQGSRHEKLVQVTDIFNKNMLAAHRLLVLLISGVSSGMFPYGMLNNLTGDLPQDQGVDWKNLILEMTRSLPYNPTSEMDLNLWKASQAIRNDPQACDELSTTPAAELSRRYMEGRLSEITLREVHKFLDRYGLRGLAEIDVGRQRWSEDPGHIFEVLSGYLRIEDPHQTPEVVFARSAVAANEALEKLCAALKKQPGGFIKVRQARFFAGRLRELMGLRETPKFLIVRLFGIFRKSLIQIGNEYMVAGELASADDLFFLTFAEIRRFAAQEKNDWQGLVAQRREVYQREMIRRNIPKLMLSDGRVFYDGIDSSRVSEGAGLKGSPVSPGSAEGRVRIVFDPSQSHLEPGEILVCPGTDPSWTPLFLTAAGLVMEVGGMMTHGAVVAREYGIPAVVGVHQATQRLQTGQRIRIDGSSGSIEIL